MIDTQDNKLVSIIPKLELIHFDQEQFINQQSQILLANKADFFTPSPYEDYLYDDYVALSEDDNHVLISDEPGNAYAVAEIGFSIAAGNAEEVIQYLLNEYYYVMFIQNINVIKKASDDKLALWGVEKLPTTNYLYVKWLIPYLAQSKFNTIDYGDFFSACIDDTYNLKSFTPDEVNKLMQYALGLPNLGQALLNEPFLSLLINILYYCVVINMTNSRQQMLTASEQVLLLQIAKNKQRLIEKDDLTELDELIHLTK